jgi:serine/threonine protein kinase
MTEQFENVIKTCDNSKFSKMKKNNFRLLVFENGGINLSQFMKNIYNDIKDKKQICIFWTNILKLLDGLLFFKENKIIHHDLKAQNIVYNFETNTIKYIDFGKMKTKEDLLRSCKNNENYEATKWFNYPPEYEHVNQSDYLAHEKKYKMEYSEFLEKVMDTFDSFSIGHMLVEILITLKSLKKTLLPTSFYDGAIVIFYTLSDPNIKTRTSDIELIRKQYLELLEYHKMYIPQTFHSLNEKMKKNMKKYMKHRVSQTDLHTLSKVLRGGFFNPIQFSRKKRYITPITK